MEPVGLLVGGILALVLGVTLFDDDDNKSQPEPEMDDEGRLTGTDGDDEIVYESGDPDYPREIRADDGDGDGDDTVELMEGIDVYGEDGDDRIEIGESYSDLLDGGDGDGDGDDLIDVTIIGGSAIYGGAGDDTINVTERVVDEPALVDAGEGDDVINYSLDFSGFPEGGEAPLLTLGDGADTLNLDLGVGMLTETSPTATSATILDFNGQQDVLDVTVSRANFTGFTLEETEDGTTLSLNYLQETDDAIEYVVTAQIVMPGAFDIPADAINITNMIGR